MNQKVNFGMSRIVANVKGDRVEIPLDDLAVVKEQAEQAVLGMRSVGYYPTPTVAAELWRSGEFADAIVEIMGYISFFIHDLPVDAICPPDSKVYEFGRDLVAADKLDEVDRMKVEGFALSNMLTKAVLHTEEVLKQIASITTQDKYTVPFPVDNINPLGLVMSSGICATPFRLHYLASIGCSLDSIFQMESESEGMVDSDLPPDALREMIQLATTYSNNTSDKSELVMLAREMMSEATAPLLKKVEEYYAALLSVLEVVAPAGVSEAYFKNLDDLYWQAKKYAEQFVSQNAYVNPIQHTLAEWDNIEQNAARLTVHLGTGTAIAEICTLVSVTNLHYLPGQFSSKLHSLNVEAMKQLKGIA